MCSRAGCKMEEAAKYICCFRRKSTRAGVPSRQVDGPSDLSGIFPFSCTHAFGAALTARCVTRVNSLLNVFATLNIHASTQLTFLPRVCAGVFPHVRQDPTSRTLHGYQSRFVIHSALGEATPCHFNLTPLFNHRRTSLGLAEGRLWSGADAHVLVAHL